MHYAHNEQAFTFGMGGYFSPQEYFLANVPFTWAGHYQTRWHYEILGGFGVQAFQQDTTPLFPLAAQKATEVALNNAALPALDQRRGELQSARQPLRTRSARTGSPADS